MKHPALARARPRHTPGTMNRLEMEYAGVLALGVRVGQVLAYSFEPVKFRIGEKCFYTPDFRVITPEGYLEFHEVKGFWEDDARVKIKAAAELHPHVFVGATKEKGAWVLERFEGTGEPCDYR